MKKLLSLVLAAMMLLSCGMAMADDDTQTAWMETKVAKEAQFAEERDSSLSTNSGETSAQQKTDVWLQVEASGQIDVTVPLVAVFKTNIDGYKAGKDISTAYVITNHSTAPLAVTKVEIVDQNTNVTVNGQTSNMKMVKVSEITDSVYDRYALTMLPDDQYATPVWAAAQDVGDADVMPDDEEDADWTGTKFLMKAEGNTFKYTLDSESAYGTETQGLWLIDRKTAGATDGTDSYVELKLYTSPLSFVTQKKNTILNGTEETADKDAVENGIKLFTITYTLKIDDSEAKGEDIIDDGILPAAADTDAEKAPYHYEYPDPDAAINP